MTPASSDPTPAAAATPATLGAWFKRRLLRALLVMTALCTVITLLLSAIYRNDHVAEHFVYSFSIGFACWTFTDGIRLMVAYGAQRLRQRRGLAPSDIGVFTGWRVLVPLIVVGTAMGLPAGVKLADALLGGPSPGLLQWDSPAARVTLAITVTAALFMFFAMSTLERLAAARIHAEAARAQASQLELRLLQSQLEPHMLFNTLANLRVLIGLDAERAQTMLDHLIAFLRATLNASRVERHALSTEFARVTEYLSLMGYRMGPRLQTRLDLPAALAQAGVPPLILQPLVENAIRHGLEPQVAPGRIEVTAEQVRSAGHALLRLTVRDTGVGLQALPAHPDSSRFGLEQVRARLRTLYGDSASMTLQACDDAEGGALAVIELPLTSLQA